MTIPLLARVASGNWHAALWSFGIAVVFLALYPYLSTRRVAVRQYKAVTKGEGRRFRLVADEDAIRLLDRDGARSTFPWPRVKEISLAADGIAIYDQDEEILFVPPDAFHGAVTAQFIADALRALQRPA